MAINYDGDQYYSNITGQSYATHDEAFAAEGAASGANLTGPPAVGSAARWVGGATPGIDPTAPATSAAPYVDPGSPSYKGPGYVLTTDNRGNSVARLSDDPIKRAAQIDWERAASGAPPAAPANPNGSTQDIVNQTLAQLGIGPKPAAPAPVSADRTSAPGQGVQGTHVAITPKPVAALPIDTTGIDPAALAARANPAAASNPSTPPPAAPKVDTTKSDQSVAGVNNTISQLLALANQSPQSSAAEAQLQKADQLAKLRAIDELRNNQAAALGASRSSRNRADAGVLERQAVGESAYLGTKAQQQDALRQAELEGNLATLRANEEQTDFTNRANILGKAADLGLNVAALDVDVAKADLSSASNYLNDQFQQLGIDKQISAQEMANVLSFTQAMSAIQFDYDKMGNDDQQHTLDLMMQQYGIDKNAASALQQIKESRKMNWGQLLTGMVGGAAQGGIQVAGTYAMKPAAPAAPALGAV